MATPANEREGLQGIWIRDPRRMFPPTNVYVPVWTACGQQPLMTCLVHEDYVPQMLCRPPVTKNPEPFGIEAPDFTPDNATYYHADEAHVREAEAAAHELASKLRQQENAADTLARRTARRERRRLKQLRRQTHRA